MASAEEKKSRRRTIVVYAKAGDASEALDADGVPSSDAPLSPKEKLMKTKNLMYSDREAELLEDLCRLLIGVQPGFVRRSLSLSSCFSRGIEDANIFEILHPSVFFQLSRPKRIRTASSFSSGTNFNSRWLNLASVLSFCLRNTAILMESSLPEITFENFRIFAVLRREQRPTSSGTLLGVHFPKASRHSPCPVNWDFVHF